MPRKITTAIILLKNTFAQEYITQIMSKNGIQFLPSPNNANQATMLINLHKPDLFICEDSDDTVERILPNLKKIDYCPKTILFVEQSKIDEIIEFYSWGILGILRGDSPLHELSEAIHSVISNHVYICQAYKKTIKKEQLDSTQIYYKLSNREKQVMSLISHGLTNPQIGEKLKLSPHSINNHRAKIRKKLNITGGKSSLVQMAISSGFDA